MLGGAWLDALGRADKSVVNRILADDFLGVDASGGEISKGPLPATGRGQSIFNPGPIEPAHQGPGSSTRLPYFATVRDRSASPEGSATASST